MGKIFSAPKSIEVPSYQSDVKQYRKDIEQYRKNVQELAKTHGKGKYAGKVLSLPYADGKASYVVVSLKPVQLIHLADGDAYEYPYVHRMTASDIRKRIDADEHLGRLFGKK